MYLLDTPPFWMKRSVTDPTLVFHGLASVTPGAEDTNQTFGATQSTAQLGVAASRTPALALNFLTLNLLEVA